MSSDTGLTAIEAWMLSCILFVFGALVGMFGEMHRTVSAASHFSEYAMILLRKQSESIKPLDKHVKVNIPKLSFSWLV